MANPGSTSSPGQTLLLDTNVLIISVRAGEASQRLRMLLGMEAGAIQGFISIVNTVNTVGVMGKGIALMFKERFPDNYRAYEAACKRGEVRVGRMFVTESLELNGSRWIINFPTKKHWRNPSELQWIIDGLKDLRAVIVKNGIRSIAIPSLGCGNGGLDWSVVSQLIESTMSELTDVEIVLYEPAASQPDAAKWRGVHHE